MKNASLFGLLLVLLTSGNAFAAPSQDDFEKTCREYAEEDKVAADEMDSYLKECVENLKAESSGADKE
ncbi:MAG: hypothetical protein PVG66_04390 [Chromatiales bacterium]|jgi:hypothetical protein